MVKMLRKKTSAPAESCIQIPWSVMSNSMTTPTWMVRNTSNQNTIDDFTEEIDEAEFVRQYNSSHVLKKLLLLCVVPHSSSLVPMAAPMPLLDVTSDYHSQVRESPVWITIPNFLFPPDMLAMRTARPKWNHSKLYGSSAGYGER